MHKVKYMHTFTRCNFISINFQFEVKTAINSELEKLSAFWKTDLGAVKMVLQINKVRKKCSTSIWTKALKQ